jgi:hypothetical protein
MLTASRPVPGARNARWLAAPVVLWLALAPAGPAQAASAADTFAGQVVITQRSIPYRFASQGAQIAWCRSARQKVVSAEKVDGKETGKWKLNYMIFFKAPINDVQVDVAFYDVTDGAPRLIDTTTQYLNTRKERIIVADIELEKPKFSPNRKIEMRVLNRGTTHAKAQFFLKGDGPRYSGKVTFDESER